MLAIKSVLGKGSTAEIRLAVLPFNYLPSSIENQSDGGSSVQIIWFHKTTPERILITLNPYLESV